MKPVNHITVISFSKGDNRVVLTLFFFQMQPEKPKYIALSIHSKYERKSKSFCE